MTEATPVLSISHARRLWWRFDGSPWPTLPVDRRHVYVSLDPCEGYEHDVEVVRETFLDVAARFPLPCKVDLVLTPFDAAGRQNAETHNCANYDKKQEEDRGELEPVIVLFGKRIPPHPAMTRYLVAHEYGHVVNEVVARRLLKGQHPQILADYAKLRGLPEQVGNGPGLWHQAHAEVFANDFRVLVAGVETEFWPHPGIPRPTETGLPELRGWWVARAAEAVEFQKSRTVEPEVKP